MVLQIIVIKKLRASLFSQKKSKSHDSRELIIFNVQANCFFIDKTKITSANKRILGRSFKSDITGCFHDIPQDTNCPYLSECSINFLYFSILHAFELILDKPEWYAQGKI